MKHTAINIASFLGALVISITIVSRAMHYANSIWPGSLIAILFFYIPWILASLSVILGLILVYAEKNKKVKLLLPKDVMVFLLMIFLFSCIGFLYQYMTTEDFLNQMGGACAGISC